jgi:D-tyrosyl-tRNA(Tyr) deacylase
VKAVIQRVTGASVTVDGVVKGSIESGLLVYLGVALDDAPSDAQWLAEKIAHIRIFEDTSGKMNLSLKDIDGGTLVVSQFTLMGDARKGRRPSWSAAAPPEKAKYLYEHFIDRIREQGLPCENGEFQAHMKVTYTNDGPVTILLDSKSLDI